MICNLKVQCEYNTGKCSWCLPSFDTDLCQHLLCWFSTFEYPWCRHSKFGNLPVQPGIFFLWLDYSLWFMFSSTCHILGNSNIKNQCASVWLDVYWSDMMFVEMYICSPASQPIFRCMWPSTLKSMTGNTLTIFLGRSDVPLVGTWVYY